MSSANRELLFDLALGLVVGALIIAFMVLATGCWEREPSVECVKRYHPVHERYKLDCHGAVGRR